METEKTIGDLLTDLAAMVSNAQNAWQDFDIEQLLVLLAAIADQAPRIIDAVWATDDSTA